MKREERRKEIIKIIIENKEVDIEDMEGRFEV